MTIEWKHRVKVYKFGARWTWKCRSTYCAQGSSSRHWRWEHALAAGIEHVRGGGFWCWPA